jgi:hypothetical protein
MIYPLIRKKCNKRRLHKENQPLEQLDRVIEEIREMMVRSTKRILSTKEVEIEEILQSSREEEATTTTKKEQDGQLQGEVWDPGGFQQRRELMSRSS